MLGRWVEFDDGRVIAAITIAHRTTEVGLRNKLFVRDRNFDVTRELVDASHDAGTDAGSFLIPECDGVSNTNNFTALGDERD
jgi:hypothetical protein